MKKNVRREISFLVLSAFLFLQVLPFLSPSIQNLPILYTLKKASFFNPPSIDAAGISSTSATLSNPRLSVLGQINGVVGIGAGLVTVKSSGNNADLDTANIFPSDSVQVGTNLGILVASTSASTFSLRSGLPVAAAANDPFYSTQSGTMKVTFYTSSPIPANGSITVALPAPAVAGNDGVPNTANSIGSNGFDANGLAAGNIAANMTCPGGFTVSTSPVIATGGVHKFHCNNGASIVAAGVPLTVVIGTGANPLINPAPLYSGHSRGVSDVYSLSVGVYPSADGAGYVQEESSASVAALEGVLVSATVDETLSFTVGGLGAGTYCNVASVVVTTATSVPWGVINSTYVQARQNAAQLLTVSTNAVGGYTVYAEENDQMGRNGNVCTGLTAGGDGFTYTAGICIKDYNKGLASHTTAADWTVAPGTDYGFGYSLEQVSAGCVTNACTPFKYNTTGVFSAKHFADIEGGNDKYAANAHIMHWTGPVTSEQARVCYRIHISGTQPAGYYYNKVKYTAVAKF